MTQGKDITNKFESFSEAFLSLSKISQVKLERLPASNFTLGHGPFIQDSKENVFYDLRPYNEKSIWGHGHPIMLQAAYNLKESNDSIDFTRLRKITKFSHITFAGSFDEIKNFYLQKKYKFLSSQKFLESDCEDDAVLLFSLTDIDFLSQLKDKISKYSKKLVIIEKNCFGLKSSLINFNEENITTYSNLWIDSFLGFSHHNNLSIQNEPSFLEVNLINSFLRFSDEANIINHSGRLDKISSLLAKLFTGHITIGLGVKLKSYSKPIADIMQSNGIIITNQWLFFPISIKDCHIEQIHKLVLKSYGEL